MLLQKIIKLISFYQKRRYHNRNSGQFHSGTIKGNRPHQQWPIYSF